MTGIMDRRRTDPDRSGFAASRGGGPGRWSLALAALLILAGGAACCASPQGSLAPDRRPQLILDDSVARDLAALAGDTWDQFLQAMGGRAGCFDDVRLRASRTLGDRAVYDPDTATVTVRVPGAAVPLQSALIHEWAHHVEFQCEAQQELRAAFLLAQGLPAITEWRPEAALADLPASQWAEIPSEQYAEAVVALVLGDQVPTIVTVSGEAVQVIADWAAAAGR